MLEKDELLLKAQEVKLALKTVIQVRRSCLSICLFIMVTINHCVMSQHFIEDNCWIFPSVALGEELRS